MFLKEFAKMINGKEYGYSMFTADELRTAKESGIVIVTGASDDLIEFEGAMCDEGSCYNGGIIYFDGEGISTDGSMRANAIQACWCDPNAKAEDGDMITWSYRTRIPHETFMVYDEGEAYCRGIIFYVDSLL